MTCFVCKNPIMSYEPYVIRAREEDERASILHKDCATDEWKK